MGLVGLLAAKMLNLQTSGIYHTDIPEYVRILTEDRFLESLAWSYMHWLYGQVDTVFVNSEFYRKCWIDRGFAPEKLKILPRGLDTELFNPVRRDLTFWPGSGTNGSEVRLLYVGRISREKDLDVLATAYKKIRRAGHPVKLYFVGLGPYRDALVASLPDAIFLGYLKGEALAKAYASADVFVFPSTTDTFGNVVLEAQASGLPVIVSDLGGPKELVEDGTTGIVTKAHDASDFARAIERISGDAKLRARMGHEARQSVIDRSWPGAFRKFWQATEL
jgi:glycosyltransferase involved in cell wall biosynthesis